MATIVRYWPTGFARNPMHTDEPHWICGKSDWLILCHTSNGQTIWRNHLSDVVHFKGKNQAKRFIQSMQDAPDPKKLSYELILN